MMQNTGPGESAHTFLSLYYFGVVIIEIASKQQHDSAHTRSLHKVIVRLLCINDFVPEAAAAAAHYPAATAAPVPPGTVPAAAAAAAAA